MTAPTQLILGMQLDNDAFSENPKYEIEEVLKRCISTLRGADRWHAGDKIYLRDTNGNAIGHAVFK